MFDSKARLDAQTFNSIDAMIRAYADEAVLVAREQHRVLLDYTAASVDALERLLDGQAAVDLAGTAYGSSRPIRAAANQVPRPAPSFPHSMWQDRVCGPP